MNGSSFSSEDVRELLDDDDEEEEEEEKRGVRIGIHS